MKYLWSSLLLMCILLNGCDNVELGFNDSEDQIINAPTENQKLSKYDARISELENRIKQQSNVNMVLAAHIGRLDAENARLENEINKLGARWVQDRLTPEDD